MLRPSTPQRATVQALLASPQITPRASLDRTRTPQRSLGKSQSCQALQGSPAAEGGEGFRWTQVDFPALAGSQDRLAPLPFEAVRKPAVPGLQSTAAGSSTIAALPKGPFAGVVRQASQPSRIGGDVVEARDMVQVKLAGTVPDSRPPSASPGRMRRSVSQSETRVGDGSAGEEGAFRDASLKAAEMAQLRSDIYTLEQRLASTALQCSSNHNPSLLSTFMQDFGRLQQLHKKAGLPSEVSQAQIALRLAGAAARMVQPAAVCVPVPIVAPVSAPGTPRATSQIMPLIPSAAPPLVLPATAGFPAEELKAMTEMQSRRKSKVTVVNPRNGEECVINTAVQFQWEKTKRMRIVDPCTGLEVLPCRIKDGEKDVVSQSDAVSSQAAGRNARASQMLNSNSMPVLELMSGYSWDWPLSRQERKERALMLNQLELLSEIDELREQSGHCTVEKINRRVSGIGTRPA